MTPNSFTYSIRSGNLNLPRFYRRYPSTMFTRKAFLIAENHPCALSDARAPVTATAASFSEEQRCCKGQGMRADKLVASYRVSTARQEASGLGLDAQRQAVAVLLGRAAVVAEFRPAGRDRRPRRRPNQHRLQGRAAPDRPCAFGSAQPIPTGTTHARPSSPRRGLG